MTMKKFQSTVCFALLLNITHVTAQFNSVFDLSQLNGENGFIINGEQGDDFARARNAGDVNNDDIDDLIIGATGSDTTETNAGAAYVVYGTNDGFPTNFDLININGSNGFGIYGQHAGQSLGSATAGAKDINNDGIDDFIISARENAFSGNNYAGSIYVIFGQNGNFPLGLDLSTLDGSNGFVIQGAALGDRIGFDVKLIDDFNGDNIDDIVISTPDTDVNDFNSGSAYLIFGTDSGFPALMNVSTLNGTNGFAIHGKVMDDFLGESISSGDINNDGLNDLILNSKKPFKLSLKNSFGTTYVVFGSSQNFSSSFDLNMLDGNNGFSVKGVDDIGFTPEHDFKLSSSSVDLNADGIDDLIISYPQASEIEYQAGATYVIYGSDQPQSAEFDLTSINGTNGFLMKGSQTSENLGFHQSSAGDINNDGYEDILLNSWKFQGTTQPFIASYVIFANPAGFPLNFNPETLNGQNGFNIKSINGTEFSVPTNLSQAGDINADGIDDILISTHQGAADTSVNYIIYGRGELIFQTGFE